ncbi:MAG TPA: hypothetical protein DHW31_04635 [Bacteroides graminisolvens]|uniref:Uncharacterized protein n=1 Tax=Bacteroides graminisolvens TaxID=477666 RepID=A0A3D2SCT8_9BACE|nr:hypothetical protein [Bacteroides graminisolvens]
MSNLFGSICLSEIPREQMKKVICKDGKERIFVNVWVGERKEPATFGNNTYTHYVSCAPKKEERVEGTNYFLGDLQTYNPQPSTPTIEQVANAPSVSPEDDLPF